MTALISMIIAILAGAYILIKGKINFSNSRELVRPKSTYVGLTLLILGVIGYWLDIYIAIALIIAVIILSYFLSQNIDRNTDNKIKNNSLLYLLILIAVVLIIGAFFYLGL